MIESDLVGIEMPTGPQPLLQVCMALLQAERPLLRPDGREPHQVLVLHGDGSYGINAMEIDTAVRHKIPVVVVISNNGGWTADAPWTRPLPKPGRNLGHTRYDRVAQELGAHGEYVEKPHDIRPALERAFASGKPAVVNVITDSKARATTVRFSAYTT